MGAMGECCCQGCELGDDDFNRADANPPTGSWYEISGNWAISGNKLIDNGGAGKLATTICHPVLYDKGAWRASFDLVECRTKSMFIVGVGNPNSSPYRVKFAFSGMDTGAAKIILTIEGDETISEEYTWPGGYSSSDTVSVGVCYEPGAKISSFVSGVGRAGIYACASTQVGNNCFSAGGVNVGGFFFVQGSFDNWVYVVNTVDDFNCTACSCTCWKAYMPRDRYEPLDYGCYPSALKAIFTLVTPSYGACILDDFEVDLTQFDYTRTIWKSGPVICPENNFELIARCVDYIDAETGMVWHMLSLQLVLFYGASVDLFWGNLNTAIGDTIAMKHPDFSLSTCSPLSLVYNRMSVLVTPRSPVPPETVPTFWRIGCCPDIFSYTPPEVQYIVTIVPA